MRKAFTLIELMISIIILSILMLFLYKSYSALNMSNKQYADEVEKIKSVELVKKTIYLDFSLLKFKSAQLFSVSRTENAFFMQSSHSLHGRINPYIAYVVKDKKLYRLESLKKFKYYPLPADSEFDVDFFGDETLFRIYINDAKAKSVKYLIHIAFKNKNDILLKIKPLNLK